MKRLLRDTKGNALIEFGLAFAIIFPLFQGVFQFGYTFYMYNQVNMAVRAAARYGALRTYDSQTATPTMAWQNAVRNMAVYRSPQGGTEPVIPGLTPDKVRVTMTFERSSPARVSVDIVNHTIDNWFRPFQLSGKPRSSFPYVGRWDPVP